jgi:hypothetical protein
MQMEYLQHTPLGESQTGIIKKGTPECPNRNEIPMMLLEVNSGLSALLPDKMIDKVDEICSRCMVN